MGEGKRERETQNPKWVPGSEMSPQTVDVGLKFTSHEVMT